MGRPKISSVLLITATFLLCLNVASTAPDGLGSFIPSLLGLFGSSHTSENIQFLGNECTYSVQPTLRNWKFLVKGTFNCPALATFSGRSLTQSKSGALKHAQTDFAERALANGILTQEEYETWIANIENEKLKKK